MYKVLNSGNYDAYLDHVKENMDNCRVEDPDLLPKIKLGLEKDHRIIIFAEFEDDKIIRSIMTKKRISVFEYIIVNIRSATNYFSKNKFLELFDFVFQYYEKEKYYKWILARPCDLFNTVYFSRLYLEPPFHKYETAIEAHSDMNNFVGTLYDIELLQGIPNKVAKNDFLIISGFCKQQYRTFDKTLTDFVV